MAIKEFIPIGLKASEISGDLKSDAAMRDMMIMSLKPLLYGFWSSSPKAVLDQLELITNSEVVGRLDGSICETMQTNDSHFVLWNPSKTRLNTLSLKQRLWELPKILRQSRKGKFRFSKADVTHLTAAYFYPRKIYMVVVATEDYLNIFPMDLHLKDPNSEAYAFGLQVTNMATSKIEQSRKVLICEIGSESLKMAYTLGKNHGRTNLFGTTLPYACKPSERFGLPVPGFAVGYREVTVEHCKDLGSHMLFLGKVAHELLPDKELEQAYHVHRFYFDFLKRKTLLSTAMEL